MEELLDSIRYNDDGIFPHEKLKELMDRKEEAIPVLLDIIEDVKETPGPFIDNPTQFDHLYACYLLAQFRVKEFFYTFIDVLRLPDEMPHDVFGDMITVDANRILASVYDGDIDAIKALIEDADVDEYVRGQAMKTLVVLVYNGELSREDVLDYFKTLMTTKLQTDNSYVNADIVSASTDLYPDEIYETIRDFYKKDVVDFGLVGLADVDRTLKEPKETYLKRQEQSTWYSYIDDTIGELRGWAAFNQPERTGTKKWQKAMPYQKKNPAKKVKKIGRNEPCPCGSGKKYKKCCG